MTAIRCEEVWKTYTQGAVAVHALQGISLAIEAGSFASLFGPSGSGKTTLLNLIGGLDIPSRGKIFLDDTRIDSLSAGERATLRLKQIGFIFQSFNLIPVLSAEENIEFTLELQGVSRKERHERSQELLAAVGLEGYGRRRPNELSGGQQQRVAVARALASDPIFVLADEPTANLDSKTAEQLLEVMQRMNEDRGVTFVFSTHDQMVMRYAKRLIGLSDGKCISDEYRI